MLYKSIKEFADVLSTSAPVPGGGGASAYVGVLGMALGSMVGNLTLGKKKYADVQEDIQDLLEKSEDIRNKLQKLINKDAEVFYPLSQAYGLPSSTEEEKAEKDKVLQQALIEASMVPLEIAENALEALKLHEEYAKKGTRIAISDVGVGVAFCEAAIKGAKLNVLINTKIMKDKDLKKKIEDKLSDIEKQGFEIAERTYSYVESLLISK